MSTVTINDVTSGVRTTVRYDQIAALVTGLGEINIFLLGNARPITIAIPQAAEFDETLGKLEKIIRGEV